jgi:hypothetical protein
MTPAQLSRTLRTSRDPRLRPDAVIGLASYAATLWLPAADGPARARRHSWLVLATAGKALVDAANAARLTVTQWTRYRRFCGWWLWPSAATFGVLPLALAELRDLPGDG